MATLSLVLSPKAQAVLGNWGDEFRDLVLSTINEALANNGELDGSYHCIEYNSQLYRLEGWVDPYDGEARVVVMTGHWKTLNVVPKGNGLHEKIKMVVADEDNADYASRT